MALLNINGFEIEFSKVGESYTIDYEVFIDGEVLPTSKEADLFQEDLDQLQKLILGKIDLVKIQVGVYDFSYGEIILFLADKDIKININAYFKFDDVDTDENYATIKYESFITKERLLNFYTNLKNEFN